MLPVFYGTYPDLIKKYMSAASTVISRLPSKKIRSASDFHKMIQYLQLLCAVTLPTLSAKHIFEDPDYLLWLRAASFELVTQLLAIECENPNLENTALMGFLSIRNYCCAIFVDIIFHGVDDAKERTRQRRMNLTTRHSEYGEELEQFGKEDPLNADQFS